MVHYKDRFKENSSDSAEKLFVFDQEVSKQAQEVWDFQQDMRIFSCEREEPAIRHWTLVLPNELGLVLLDKIGTSLPEEAKLKPDRIPYFSSDWMRVDFKAIVAKSLWIDWGVFHTGGDFSAVELDSEDWSLRNKWDIEVQAAWRGLAEAVVAVDSHFKGDELWRDCGVRDGLRSIRESCGAWGPNQEHPSETGGTEEWDWLRVIWNHLPEILQVKKVQNRISLLQNLSLQHEWYPQRR